MNNDELQKSLDKLDKLINFNIETLNNNPQQLPVEFLNELFELKRNIIEIINETKTTKRVTKKKVVPKNTTNNK